MSAIAQDKTSDIKRLLGLINSEQMAESMLNTMAPMLKLQSNEAPKGSGNKENMDKNMDVMAEEMKEIMNLLKAESVNIYDKHFTHEEIKDMIRFYESPTGKKMLEKNPEITQELMTVMMTKYMPEFQKELITKGKI
jgi:hypothetical protein